MKKMTKKLKEKQFSIFDRVMKASPWLLLLALVSSQTLAHWSKYTSDYNETVRFLYWLFFFFVALAMIYTLIQYLIRWAGNFKEKYHGTGENLK